MSIKDFIKAIKAEFGEVEYKALSKLDGKIYKTGGYDVAEENIRRRRRVDTKALW